MELSDTQFWIGLFFVGFILCELCTGQFLFRALTQKKDVLLDVLATTLVPLIIAPTVLYLAHQCTAALLPESKDALSTLTPLTMFCVFLIADDLTQYFWHRLSHSSWLYPLHRAHHSASYLSVRVVYRNNLIYYLFMPGLWLSGGLIYFGLWTVYPVYGLLKMVVIISAHSSVPWDRPLYHNRYTQHLMWLVERLISTPSTHSMHHGLHEADGVTHYKGNYGNFLFLWDVIFGTAKITRRRPQQFGIEGLVEVGWATELLIPRSAQPSHERNAPITTKFLK